MFSPRVTLGIAILAIGLGAGLSTFAQQPQGEKLPTPAPGVQGPTLAPPQTIFPAAPVTPGTVIDPGTAVGPNTVVGPNQTIIGGPGMTQSAGPFLHNEHMVVVVSPSGDRVWAYCADHGAWWEQKVKRGVEPIVPILAGKLLCFQSCGTAYAFSAQRRAWGAADMPGGIEPQMSVLGDIIIAQAGNKLFGFSVQTGRWDGFDLPRH